MCSGSGRCCGVPASGSYETRDPRLQWIRRIWKVPREKGLLRFPMRQSFGTVSPDSIDSWLTHRSIGELTAQEGLELSYSGVLGLAVGFGFFHADLKRGNLRVLLSLNFLYRFDQR